ncbi:defensin-like protein p322 [Phtheirospermum japonicum]|uniref:Defensin-like protein p322 n=1 Tax=Phtheirospermum japonicum TaxID=374723 RepID=A0A830D8K4_9LAMI|nr:defensin-like protein p322 [Phtheirospermum japonicum]
MMIMRGEAAMCEANSKLFSGACWNSNNCGSICEKERFLGGNCKFWKCVCFKECTVGGGGGGTPDGPPSNDQPAEGPPSEEQPGEGPPSEGQPGEGPPGEEMPPVHMRQS